MHDPVNFIDPSGTVAVPWHAMKPLAGLLPGLVVAVAAKTVSIKAAATTFWIPFIGKAAIAAAVAATGVVVYQTASYMIAANTARSWALDQVAAGGINPNNLSRNSVYVLFDHNRNEVFYVGRTRHFATRKSAHNRDPRFAGREFDMFAVHTNMLLEEARVLEQALISAFTLDALTNMMNSIAPHRWGEFMAEFERIQLLLSSQ